MDDDELNCMESLVWSNYLVIRCVANGIVWVKAYGAMSHSKSPLGEE
jgi:hypothetical protein